MEICYATVRLAQGRAGSLWFRSYSAVRRSGLSANLLRDKELRDRRGNRELKSCRNLGRYIYSCSICIYQREIRFRETSIYPVQP